MSWWTRKIPSVTTEPEDERKLKTEGLWEKCDGCGQIIWKKELEENLSVCTQCGFHFKLNAEERLSLLFDDGQWQELDSTLRSTDPLHFVDSKPYASRMAAMAKTTGHRDSIIAAVGTIRGRRVHCCAFNMKFIGGSMGAVVGEKIVRAIERCLAERTPLLIVSASGGARMQEGAVSLMQMARTSAALMKLDEAGLPFISLLTDPTTGGVTASFAMLGDLNIGEPGALIGFAGPRVIEQTIRQKLPPGFQRSEFLVEKGFLDAVVKRSDLRDFLANAFHFFLGPVAR
ncbi:MAG: acetyl-CoA carboxylase, carboxyltransferase subunit beta [Acidobacteria bacterium]|nr:acetyl-CoA carboxylase, carboxyltransferase subunit beta [Acidobacteriota bacterium]